LTQRAAFANTLLDSLEDTDQSSMEASGHGGWFERWPAELEFELWIGDAAEIRTQPVRKQKTDRRMRS
jgi:hypothetical protein